MAAKTIPAPEIAGALVAPGLIMRLNIGLGDQDIFQAESFLDRGASQQEIDVLADKMVRAANRLKAKAQLPGYRRQLEHVETKLTENRERLAKLEAGLKAVEDVRREEAVRLKAKAEEVQTREQDAWIAEGRRTEFKLRGAALAEFNRLNQQIGALNASQTKDEGEAAQQRSVLQNEITEGERAAYQMGRMISEAEAQVRGEDISEVGEE